MNNAFGKITVKTAGVTFQNRQGKLWNIRTFAIAHGNNSLTTMLRREPTNEYDHNAIAVLVQTDTTVAKIGYVPANIAIWLAPLMDKKNIVRAYHGHVTDAGFGKGKETLGFTFDICYQVRAIVAAD